MVEARAKATFCPYSYVLFLSVCLFVRGLQITVFDIFWLRASWDFVLLLHTKEENPVCNISV